MNSFTRKSVLLVLASLSLVALVALPAAAQPRLTLVAPDSDSYDPDFVPDFELPRFGFSSFNIAGLGERVTYVRWGGLASQLGLEPGDMILRMNDVRLTYPGSWNDALRHAILEHGGWITLRIRDVRTGVVARRQIFVGGGYGPIVSHYTTGGVSNYSSHVHRNLNVIPTGPNTMKSAIGGERRLETNRLRNIARLAD
jgi:hypothetical protein